jgi:SAM-dependent methyltransferase
MAKQGEIDYLRNGGAAVILHAADKPFSDESCADQLLDFAALMTMLPSPPASVIDLGCGSGWTSCFLARRGYAVVAQDIAPDMIDLGRSNKERYCPEADLTFIASDYEALGYENAFDAAVFHHALHHAEDETAALSGAFKALRPGGVCVVSEPGRGHDLQSHSLEAARKFNVTEKDIPVDTILALGRRVGFRAGRVFPRPSVLRRFYIPDPGRRRLNLDPLRRLAWALFPSIMSTRSEGLVLLTK